MHELNKKRKQRSELKFDLARAFREKNYTEMHRLHNVLSELDRSIATLEKMGGSPDVDRGFTCAA